MSINIKLIHITVFEKLQFPKRLKSLKTQISLKFTNPYSIINRYFKFWKKKF